MKVIKETPVYIILDDFLSGENYELVLEYTQRNDYARNPRWIKPWDLADRMPWQSGETVYVPGRKLAPDDPRKQYPTGTVLDLVIETLVATKFYRKHYSGHADTVTARSYLHPQGSSLDWHEDGGRFSGAFACYTHPAWHASWGGELMIVEDDLGLGGLPGKKHMVDGKVETYEAQWNVIHKNDLSDLLLDGTVNTQFVFPKPNRMVVLRRGYWHKINLVKNQAPYARCSIAGFILPNDDQTPLWR